MINITLSSTIGIRHDNIYVHSRLSQSLWKPQDREGLRRAWRRIQPVQQFMVCDGQYVAARTRQHS